jgi:hypothetical protein
LEDSKKPPSKPKPTTATDRQLLSHYNSQVDAYNASVDALGKAPETGRQQKFEPVEHADNGLEAEWGITRDGLIELIRRQNHRLGRHIKARSHELLLHKVPDPEDPSKPQLNKNGHTIGLTYRAILDILAAEFPEASTSAACLRWYVVHMRSDAADVGDPWPPLPQMRPRSSVSPVDAAAAEETV